MTWTGTRATTRATVVALVVLYACSGASTRTDGAGDSGRAAGSGGAAAGSAGAAAGSGAAGSGGAAGSSSGSSGVSGGGGQPNSLCPATLTMSCDPDGISCLFDAWTGCLCTEAWVGDQGIPYDCKVVDTRCPSGPIAGSTHGPISNIPKACDCVNGTFSCDPP